MQTAVTAANGSLRAPLLVAALVFTLLGFAPLLVKAQNRNQAGATAFKPVGPGRSKSAQINRKSEFRFEFIPTGHSDDSVVPTFMIVGEDGSAHGLRYHLRDQENNVASYEGMLPITDVERLFSRVRAALLLPKHRKDYDRRLVYEGDGFYLSLRSPNGRVKQISGNLETRPDEVKALIAVLRELWKQLKQVPPAFAYLTSSPIDQDRLRLLRTKYKVQLTPVESLPADLQALLIPVVTQPRNFHPLTQAQYNQIQRYTHALTHKGRGYELTILPSTKNARNLRIKGNQYEYLNSIFRERIPQGHHLQHSHAGFHRDRISRNR